MSLLNYRNPGDNIRLWRVYGKSVLRYGSVQKVVNAVRTELAYRRRDVVVATAPYILFLEPLYYCNLDCPLCDRQVFSEARKNDAGKLALATYDRILAEIGNYLFQCQIFGQGEPLMNWKLTREIIDRTHRRRIFSHMSTNCTLITAEIAEEIVTSGLDYLVCAIDGVSQESYEVYRVGGRVEDALAGLRLVCAARDNAKSKLHVEWQYLVHAGNLHEIGIARKLAAELRVTLRLAPLRGMEWDKDLEDYWLPSAGAWSQRQEPGRPIHGFPCYFLWRSLVVNSNSKVARCLVYQNVSQYTDLQESTVMAAYNHPSVQQARRLFRPGAMPEEDLPNPCSSCGQFARHHGGPVVDRNSRVRHSIGA